MSVRGRSRFPRGRAARWRRYQYAIVPPALRHGWLIKNWRKRRVQRPHRPERAWVHDYRDGETGEERICIWCRDCGKVLTTGPKHNKRFIKWCRAQERKRAKQQAGAR